MFINNYINLIQPVIDELQHQGHEVRLIDDFFEYFNPMDVERQNRLNRKKIGFWNNSVSAYWRKHENIIADKYDMFISFNGWSINNTAFELINKYSPNCTKVQYCWDSFNTWDLRLVQDYFDKLFTFDVLDAQNKGWNLLPSFFVGKEVLHAPVFSDYDLFMIGSNHDRRYSFVRKVLRAVKSYDLNNFIKIYVPPVSNIGFNFMIDCIKSGMNFSHIHEMLFKYGLEDKEYLIHEHIGLDEYIDIMKRSKCILDDNRPKQAGLSPRFIRAMALNKKVITTNEWACKYNFVNEDNVLIVDKEKPVIDPNFLASDVTRSDIPNLNYLELSNWVKILIGENECPSFEKIE